MRRKIRLLLIVLSLLFGCSAQDVPSQAAPAQVFDHVLLISVDGLRADAVADSGALPGFARLLQGQHTLNARTDPDFTVTLPNHLCMVSGRGTLGTGGHQWTSNGEPKPGATVHDGAGYVASIFDVAHDQGLGTAVLAGKSKFSLFDASWNERSGAPDITGADNGRDKIDLYLFDEDAADLTSAALAFLQREGRHLLFLHYRDCDAAGHDAGWDMTAGSKYRQAVAAVDREIVRLLDAVQADGELRGTTAILLTADHGGGAPFKSHDRADAPADYTIPLLIWLAPGQAAADLYALNPARADPGTGKGGDRPPIRNRDCAGLALDLLGLPPLPASGPGAPERLRYGPVAAE